MSFSTDFLLFDLDGTLVFSNEAVEATWNDQIIKHNALHPELPLELETFLHTSHGTRTEELFRRFFPYLPNAASDIDAFEKGIVSNYGHFAKSIPGANELLSSINITAQSRWAIVTSGTRDLAHGWMETVHANITKPQVFVTANDVTKGKPDPQGYQSAHRALEQINAKHDTTAVVFEDAPTGIRAGVAGGYVVVGIASSFPKEVLVAAGATYVVKDLRDVKVELVDGRLHLHLTQL